MADYEVTSDKLVEGIKGLKEETLAAIKDAFSGDDTPVKIFDKLPADGKFDPKEKTVFAPKAKVDKAALDKAAADLDVMDFSGLTEGLDLNFSGVNPAGAAAPKADNVIVATNFDDKVESNNSNQVTEGLDGNDSIATGSGQDSISGGEGNDSLSSGAGDDTISSGNGQDSVDGGAGFDIANVINVAIKSVFDGKTLTTTDGAGNTVVIENVQVVTFGSDYKDTQFVLDNAKQGAVARLFEGVFDRKMAVDGAKFWTESVDAQEGTDVLTQVADAFINSAEGKANNLDTMTNSDFVNKMFKEFVARDGVEAGIKFWNAGLDAGATTKEQVMAEFAQTEEATSVKDFIHIIGTNEIG